MNTLVSPLPLKIRVLGVYYVNFNHHTYDYIDLVCTVYYLYLCNNLEILNNVFICRVTILHNKIIGNH